MLVRVILPEGMEFFSCSRRNFFSNKIRWSAQLTPIINLLLLSISSSTSIMNSGGREHLMPFETKEQCSGINYYNYLFYQLSSLFIYKQSWLSHSFSSKPGETINWTKAWHQLPFNPNIRFHWIVRYSRSILSIIKCLVSFQHLLDFLFRYLSY